MADRGASVRIAGAAAFVSMADGGASVRIVGSVGFNFLRENRGSRVQSAAAFLLLYKTFYQGVLPFERRINAVDPGCRGLVINNERAGAAAFVSMAERGQGASQGLRGAAAARTGQGS